MHIPVLVKYNYESHALAGAIIGIIVALGIGHHLPRIAILGIAGGAALIFGAAKEYVLDINARPREISPWGLGAAAAVAVRFAFP